jgi:hypothetical protein
MIFPWFSHIFLGFSHDFCPISAHLLAEAWFCGPWAVSCSAVGGCPPGHWACWACRRACHTWRYLGVVGSHDGHGILHV